MGRLLQFEIFRYNPEDKDSAPHMQTFVMEETTNMTLFIALNRLREEQDPGLIFDFCCRAGICGACAMVINGRPGLACQTKTKDLPEIITLLPLPVFKLIGDLSVDTGIWFREMYQKTESWIHTTKEFDSAKEEERMDNAVAEEIYELERCVECGCCIAACGTARLREDFMGAAALNRIARFVIDPRDQRTDNQYFDIIGNDYGIFGCMGLLACEDVCPKKLPLQNQLGFLRRKMGITAIKQFIRK
ncbi:MAG: fumarate reductase iron-sulfur subunit [Desulfomicrobium sp.]|nr:fumarate reductase iron-sulfur subunit [Pseudomonadota bacterium]MBV1712795.1 fumarate reductase iron-sulfur subunit [Desulfomicrobium sp.]MBU4571765.1 fumarate reductase iron-sulfur subunit [Pseudomonadota bacterium]MBU4595914.1 fumarate reductase iron-sulfur subunit [Pseudomonadota bacterium]MBV1721218.1 fumarate reductase iron-sulfur subunit [Desulfomicrobium sp.]